MTRLLCLFSLFFVSCSNSSEVTSSNVKLVEMNFELIHNEKSNLVNSIIEAGGEKYILKGYSILENDSIKVNHYLIGKRQISYALELCTATGKQLFRDVLVYNKTNCLVERYYYRNDKLAYYLKFNSAGKIVERVDFGVSF